MDLNELELEESSGTRATEAHTVVGLVELLQDMNLQNSLTVATAWCDQNGAESIEDVVEHDMIEDFVGALELKPIPTKKLINRRASMALELPVSTTNPSVCERKPQPISISFSCRPSPNNQSDTWPCSHAVGAPTLDG